MNDGWINNEENQPILWKLVFLWVLYTNEKYPKLNRANTYCILDTYNMYQVLKERNRSKKDTVPAFKFLITLTGVHGHDIIIQRQM